MMNQYQQWQVQAQFAKSYTTPAVITLVLYCVMWVPGLIANIVYLVEANKTKQITGVTPDGYGCLLALLIAVCIVPVASSTLFVIALVFTSMAASVGR
jgi:Na+-translocating ferredoxin:NAD+ oxidoreductase RnfD subunit